jgi:threonine dehydrogenase-like Zn-dependent dehydrogenase
MEFHQGTLAGRSKGGGERKGVCVLGIGKLEARLDAQEQATREHRAFEGTALREIKGELSEVKTLAKSTNGRVNAHDVALGVIKEAERQAALIQAAKVKAEGQAKAAKEAARAARRSWQQNVLMVGAGPVGLVVGYLLLHWIEHGSP